MIDLARKLWCDESGATALEYGLIAALVSVAAIAALSQLGGSLINIYGTLATKMDDAASSSPSTPATP